MKTPSPLAFWNPALLWWRLAADTTAMLLSAGQVIGMRTTRMATARTPLSARDRREFTRMGTEKVQAAADSAVAAAARLPSLALVMTSGGAAPWLRLWGEWARVGSAALRPVHTAARSNARRLSSGKRKPRAARR